MTLDPGPVGTLAAKLMDTIERDYDGKPVELRAAIVIVDIGAIDDDGEMWTSVRWHFGERSEEWEPARCSSAYAAGLVTIALEGLTNGSEHDPYAE